MKGKEIFQNKSFYSNQVFFKTKTCLGTNQDILLKEETKGYPKTNKKIPNTGDTESFDRCRWYHHFHKE